MSTAALAGGGGVFPGTRPTDHNASDAPAAHLAMHEMALKNLNNRRRTLVVKDRAITHDPVTELETESVASSVWIGGAHEAKEHTPAHTQSEGLLLPWIGGSRVPSVERRGQWCPGAVQ
jgi:hypothetical protein